MNIDELIAALKAQAESAVEGGARRACGDPAIQRMACLLVDDTYPMALAIAWLRLREDMARPSPERPRPAAIAPEAADAPASGPLAPARAHLGLVRVRAKAGYDEVEVVESLGGLLKVRYPDAPVGKVLTVPREIVHADDQDRLPPLDATSVILEAEADRPDQKGALE